MEEKSSSSTDTGLQDLNWYATLLLPIPVWIFFGNLTVLVVIAESASLRRTWSNKIIFSLALTDMTISVVVMPFAAIGQLCRGYWPFGFGVCAFHIISDVYFCSSSIMHLMLIAVNRYAAIGWPISYRRINVATNLQALLLLGVWCLPLVIVTPLVIQIFFDPEGIYKEGHCDIFYNHFILYGSISTFYLPLLIMIAVDIRSFFLLRSKSKASQRLKSIVIHVGLEKNMTPPHYAADKRGKNKWLAPFERLIRLFAKRSPQEIAMTSTNINPETIALNNNNNININTNNYDLAIKPQSPVQVSPRLVAENGPSPTRVSSFIFSAGNISQGDDSSTTANNNRSCERNSAATEGELKKQQRQSVGSVTLLLAPVRKFFKKQRAETALLTVFGVFVFCWMPFFTINVLQTIVPEVQHEDFLFLAFVWLGYCSSGLNPIIYPVFNSEYRKCFMRTFSRAQAEHHASHHHPFSRSRHNNATSMSIQPQASSAHPHAERQRSAPEFPRITSQSMLAFSSTSAAAGNETSGRRRSMSAAVIEHKLEALVAAAEENSRIGHIDTDDDDDEDYYNSDSHNSTVIPV